MSSTKSPRGTYIHGTEPSEQERLAELNRLTNRAFIEFLDVRPGQRVLEVGSGLGILAAQVASAARDVRLVAVEQSSSQPAAAVKTPRVACVQGDAHALDFADASFDLVSARYLLEHVKEPERVLKEMDRGHASRRTGGRL
jgi:demethylmenaquinone methyltransferase / 2-methoxy-6-polyprenyl-1,4-benzoquinol methylase